MAETKDAIRVADELCELFCDESWFLTVAVQQKNGDDYIRLFCSALPTNEELSSAAKDQIGMGFEIVAELNSDIAAPSDMIEHPRDWKGPFVIQRFVFDDDSRKREWQDLVTLTDVDAADLQEAALSICRDVSQWPETLPLIGRMVRVVKLCYSAAQAPKGETAFAYWTRTKGETLLMFNADPRSAPKGNSVDA